MNKSLESLIQEAYKKWEYWQHISPKQLKDLNKTKDDAIALSNYYEGRFDAFTSIRGMIR